MNCFAFSLVLLSAMYWYYAFIFLFESHYIMEIMWCFSFMYFNTAKALISEFACGVSHRFPSCKFSSCSRYCVRGYQPNARYPFANCNKCVRKDDGGCGERPSSPTHSPPCIAFSYHSKYLIYQADCRSSSRTRLRFLFFVPWYTASISDKAVWVRTPACAYPYSWSLQHREISPRQ